MSYKIDIAIAALKKAYMELNEIRARDGVPYTSYGTKACVDESYFSSVVDDVFNALKALQDIKKP